MSGQDDTDFLDQAVDGSGRDLAGAAAQGRRWMFLDALRGFDMFWITGGGFVVTALRGASENVVTDFLKTQLTHVEWEGFHFYDLIFPLFVFLAGVSTVLSLDKAVAAHGRLGAMRRLVFRGILLFVLGIIYSGGISKGWPDVRVMGVLQRIALSYTGAGLIYLWLPERLLPWILAVLLGGYYGAVSWLPIRDIKLQPDVVKSLVEEAGGVDIRAIYSRTTNWVTGVYEPGYNVAHHFDFEHLPGRLYDKFWDPEGILSTWPAVGTCLLGVLAALLLRRGDVSPGEKTVRLLLWGIGLILGGLFWSLWLPVIKKMWTSSYVLLAGGWSLVLMAVFHHVIEVHGSRRWCQPFVWVGTNSITIYFASQLLGFPRIAERLVGGPLRRGLGGAGQVLVGVVAILLLFWFARFLHRRKVFIRL